MRWIVVCSLWLGLGSALVAQAVTSAPSLGRSRPAPKIVVDQARLMVDIARLSSPEFAGRSGPLKEKSRAFLESRFRGLGLAFIANTSYRHGFSMAGQAGCNLIGLKKSQHPQASGQHVIVSAHYDHLGSRDGKVFPGAADNAAGVAAMLEIARLWDPKTMRHDLLVVAFDLEERGLLGSFAYAEKPPLLLKNCALFVTMDILGRKALGYIAGTTFVQGWEWTPAMLPGLKKAAQQTGNVFSYFWSDVGGNRSDFVAFKRKRVPHLFFSTGENEDYHKPSDVAQNIDLALLRRQVEGIWSFLKVAVAAAATYEYRSAAALHVVEFESLRDLAGALARSSDVRLTPILRQQAMVLLAYATRVAKSGQVNSKDRAFLLRSSQQLQMALR